MRQLTTKIDAFPAIIMVIAIFLQIQVSLFATDGYLGLRVNLADFLLPFVGIFVILSLLFKQSRWPRWVIKGSYAWLVCLALVMTLALYTGYLSNGFLSSWAFINKYIGFIILLCYFALGGWVISNSLERENLRRYFAKAFCGLFLIVLCLSALSTFINPVFKLPYNLGEFSWDGLMANRNAFMLAAIFTIILMETYRFMKQPLFSGWVYSALWVLMPLFFVCNSSRTGWIFGALFLLFLGFWHWRTVLKKITPFLILGSLLAWMFMQSPLAKGIHAGDQFDYMGRVIEQDFSYGGDFKRLIAVEDGTELYAQSNKLTGAGLGVYQEFQKEKRGEYIDVIDFTPLWLLTETGLIGLGVFSMFFIMCAYHLYRLQKLEDENDEVSPFIRASLLFLIAIAGMSFLHELLYTRFLWFVLGMALVASSLPKNAKA